MLANKGYGAYANSKIMTASPAELTLMLYEGAIKFCNIAIVGIEQNDIEKAHNNIVKVLPYGEKDGLLARVAATYYLMEKGYPAVTPDVKEQEYNEKVEKTLKTGELQGFNELLKKEVMDRLGLMIQLTAY